MDKTRRRSRRRVRLNSRNEIRAFKYLVSGREVQVLGPVGFLPNQWCRLDGAPVPMVDGGDTNDAVALGEADVSIVMTTVTDIAMSGAPVTLIKGDSRGVWRVRVVSINRTEHAAEPCFFLCPSGGECAQCGGYLVSVVQLGTQSNDRSAGKGSAVGVSGGKHTATALRAFTCGG